MDPKQCRHLFILVFSMVKNDFETLFTACLVAVLLFAANFDTAVKNIESIYSEFENYKLSETYKALQTLKNTESSFWTKLKGTESNNGDINEILTDNSTPNIPTKQTPTSVNLQKIIPPVKFLLVGDSMMLVGFGPALENNLLKYKGVSVVREGAYSTGLNRIDYFDWFTKTDELITRYQPDVLIVMFGGNDGQGIIDKDKKAHDFGTESWKEVYRQRVNIYLSRVSPKVKKIYWIGHPIPGNQSFLDKFQTMNPIYQSETAKFANAKFVDTWERFAVNGEYRQSIPDDIGLWQIAKSSDGVHVTDFGGGILANLLIKEILKDIDLK